MQAADTEDIMLAEAREGQPAGSAGRSPLSIDLPQPSSEPTPDNPTPLSSLGGRVSQGQTPLAGAGPTQDTALFYNGLFKSSFSGRGRQGWCQTVTMLRPDIVKTVCDYHSTNIVFNDSPATSLAVDSTTSVRIC